MNKSTFHEIIIIQIFKDELPEKYDEEFQDWLDDEIGELRIIPIQHEFENIDLEHKEIIIRVHGEDAHSGNRKEVIVYSNFDGEIRGMSQG